MHFTDLSERERQRFWGKVDKSADGCWRWTRATDHEGYGVFFLRGKMWRSHRVSFEMAKGIIPEGMYVCHACDNPSCVNPDHLWPGTAVQNMRDCVTKGRWRAELGSGRKLTAESARAVRNASGSSYAIAEQYGISSSMVRAIKTGQYWREDAA